MALLTLASQVTLLELANRLNNKVLLAIAEVLNKTNEIFGDMLWSPANGTVGHVHTRRAALPSGTWRGINEGVAAEASQTFQVTEPIGLLEGRSQIDDYLVGLASDEMQFRYDEDMSFVEGLGQTFLTAFFYGNISTAPKSLNGLGVRYTSHTNDSNVESAGGSTALTSAHLIQFGKKRVELVYPTNHKMSNSPMGGDPGTESHVNVVEMKNLGLQLVSDGTNDYTAFVTRFRINAGLVVHDDRCYQRQSNIESDGDPGFDPDKMIKLINATLERGKGSILCVNRTGLTQLDQIAKEDTNVQYKPAEAFGIPTTYYRGIPVRLCESITDAETATT